MADHGREQFSYKDGFKVVDEFEALLKRHGVPVAGSTEIDLHLCNAAEFLHNYESKIRLETDPEKKKSLEISFGGLCDMAMKSLAASTTPGWKSLLPHLEKFALSKFNVFDSNHGHGVEFQNGDKMFEYYVGCLCSLFSEHVEIDHPDHSSGDNPDVIFAHYDQRIALACKTLHSSNPRTIRDNIDKAVAQIKKSKCDWGIPVISVRNIFTSNDLWSRYSGSLDYMPLTRHLINTLHSLCKKVEVEMGNVEKTFAGTRSLPGVIFISNLVVRLGDTPFTTPTSARLNTMYFHRFMPESESEQQRSVLDLINHYMQVVHVKSTQPHQRSATKAPSAQNKSKNRRTVAKRSIKRKPSKKR